MLVASIPNPVVNQSRAAIGKTAIYLMISCVLLACSSLAREAHSIDRQLLDAVLADDFPIFQKLIDTGGDPHQIFGPETDDWAICASTHPSKLRFLKELLAAGRSANGINPTATQSRATPLGCALVHDNMTAFKLLLVSGADPEAVQCETCNPEHQDSLLISSLTLTRWEMVLLLLDTVQLSQLEIDFLINTIETVAANTSHKTFPFRRKVIDVMLANGYDMDWRNPETREPGSTRVRKTIRFKTSPGSYLVPVEIKRPSELGIPVP